MIETPPPRVPEQQALAPDHAALLELLATLWRENAALRAENAALRVKNGALHERIRELEARLGRLLRRGQDTCWTSSWRWARRHSKALRPHRSSRPGREIVAC